MAAAPAAGGQGAALAPQARGPQEELARGAEGARPWDGHWNAVHDPLGGQTLPLVVEVYGWLSCASSGAHQGDEEMALQCRAPLEGWGELGGAPGVVGDPGGPGEGPPGCDLGGVARQGADLAGFPGAGGGAPHHGCGGQQLAPPGPAHRPHPLALPPAEPTAAAAQPPDKRRRR